MNVSDLIKRVGLGVVVLGAAYYLFILEPEPSPQPKAVSAQRASHRGSPKTVRATARSTVRASNSSELLTRGDSGRSTPSAVSPKPKRRASRTSSPSLNEMKKSAPPRAPVGLNNPLTVTDESDEGDAEVENDLVYSTDREGVKAAMKEVGDQVHECYSAWLQSNPELGGRVVVSFSVTPPAQAEGEGGAEQATPEVAQITDAELIVDDVAHPMMSGCILNSVEGMKFEAPDKPFTVRYPFSLSAAPASE